MNEKILKCTAPFLTAALSIGLSIQAVASTQTVDMKSIIFEPKVIQIHVGDTVTWKNVSLTPHSATGDAQVASIDGKAKDPANSTESAFDTGTVEPKSSSKPVKFTSAGNYPYHCSVHGKTMSGVVVVKAKN